MGEAVLAIPCRIMTPPFCHAGLLGLQSQARTGTKRRREKCRWDTVYTWTVLPPTREISREEEPWAYEPGVSLLGALLLFRTPLSKRASIDLTPLGASITFSHC
jgi:hypothetical protein